MLLANSANGMQLLRLAPLASFHILRLIAARNTPYGPFLNAVPNWRQAAPAQSQPTQLFRLSFEMYTSSAEW